jgi:DNA-binding CsgD family transcriptional regulator
LALLKQKSRVGVLVITTTSTRAPVSQAELDELAIIAPHLRRAVTIGNLFETEVSETDTYRDVLNQIATAIFVVSSDMKLRFANPSAEQLLKEGTLLKLINDALMFLTPMVQASIQRAVLLGERSEVALGTLGIGVPTASVNLPAIAYVLPMSNRADAGRIDNGAAATIFVSLPGSDVLPAVEALAGLFGLTPAEKRVTRLVADGKTRAEIAAAHGVSDGTVKSQLDAIYNKTQVKGQRKLQDLVRLLTPPINAKS